MFQPAQAQLTNGSFENGNFTEINGHGDANVTRLFAGDTNITGWTVIGELAWAQSPNRYGLATPYGNRFLDLTGYNDSVPYGGVEQAINTTIGTTYELTFAVGVDNDNPLFVSPVSLTAFAGSTSQTFTNNSKGSGNQWQSFSLDFTATSSTTLVAFQGASGINYIGLDNVAVTSVPTNPNVPEPGAYALFASLGLTGLTLLLRKRAR